MILTVMYQSENFRLDRMRYLSKTVGILYAKDNQTHEFSPRATLLNNRQLQHVRNIIANDIDKQYLLLVPFLDDQFFTVLTFTAEESKSSNAALLCELERIARREGIELTPSNSDPSETKTQIERYTLPIGTPLNKQFNDRKEPK